MPEEPPIQRLSQGTSRSYVIGRLQQQGLHDLAAAVEAGTVSAFAAAVECGWARRPPTLRAITNQARRRQHQLQAIAGDNLSSNQLMELWLGPGHDGSYFSSTEELEQAWQTHRDEILRLFGQSGRRPQAWWCFDAPELGLQWPGYDREQSYLFEADGVLSESERGELLAFWRREFDRNRKPAHLDWADLPHSLRKTWSAEKRGPKKRTGLAV
jgi:hypothetical protein